MEQVCLIIKAANQKYEDIKINCNLSWTVLDLKSHLSVHYPSKPKITDQRIIYSGHLLKDNQLMRNIIQLSGDSQNIFTFHLVCPQKPINKASNDANNKVSNNNSFSTAIPSNISAQSLPSNPSSSNAYVWNQISNLNVQTHIRPDNLLMQQSYQVLMNQYYQFMSYYFFSSPPIDYASYAAYTNAYIQSFNNNFNVSDDNINGQQQQPQQNSNSVSANNENNNNENRPNNRNNNQAENEDMNRDWADWMYSISKAIVMLNIIYFYSSLNRLVLFLSIFFIIYFYKNLLNGFPNRNEQINGRAAQNNRTRNPVNNNNPNQMPDGAAGELNRTLDHNNNNDELAQDNSRYSGLRFVWVFVTSLFTSLIPDPVRIN